MQNLSGVEGSIRAHSGGIEWLARAGYATRGFLYVIIGLLAGLTALGRGGQTTDSKGALIKLYQQPFGQALLVLAALGLFGFAAFRAYHAVLDPEHGERGGAGVAKRIGWALAALLHVSLGIFAVSVLQGTSGGGTDVRSGTAELLAWAPPLGRCLVAAAGLGVVAFAFQQLACSWRAKLDDQLDLSALSQRARTLAIRTSRVGIAARALVFLIAGGFLVVAAVTANPNDAKGFGDSLATLRDTPVGAPLLGAVAVGLLAFAVYQLIEARYRRIAH
ncbi:MAG: rane protein [Polyangiaceae bacterium]|jgi:hypothetical protein|nr:rane protein [Polyangiaceae bacterium]